MGIESRGPQLTAAKSRNDSAIAAILAVAVKEQVAAADVQADFIEISPVYQNRDSAESRENYLVDYYRVNKTVTITLRDVTRFERLLTAILNAGANRVYGVDFQTSDLRKYRDQARDMAAAAGLRVDKPESISAYNQGGGPSYGRGRANMNMVQNVSPCRISVNPSVTLTFRLLP